MKRTLTGIAAAALVLSTLTPAAFAATGSSTTYSDISGSFAANAINTLTSDGFIHGFSDGTYRPTNPVTRGQFLAYFMKAMESVTGVKPVAQEQYFADIAPGNWAFNFVGAAEAAKWINPYWMGVRSGYNFNENFHASRGDAAALFVSSMVAAGKLQMSDLNGMSPLKYAYSVGLFSGLPSTEDQTYMNRADAAVVLDNIIQWTQGQLLPTGAVVTVKGTSANLAPNSNEQLTVTAATYGGQAITLPTGAQVTWSVDNQNGFVNGTGTTANLVVTQAGTYNVTATVDGVQSQPFKVTVFGQAQGLTVTPASASVPANNVTTDAVKLQVVDSNGNPVSNFTGTVQVQDTAGLLENSSGGAVGANSPISVPVTNGVATVTLKAGTQTGVTDTITANQVTSSAGTVVLNSSGVAAQGTATVSTVAQVPTTLKLTPSSAYIANNLATNTQTVTAQLLDQAGAPMLTGVYPVTFSATGAGSIATNAVDEVIDGYNNASNASVTTTVYSQQGVNGTVTVTGSAAISAGTNLVGTTTLTAVTVGTPYAISMQPTSGASTTVSANGTTTFQVGIVDASGHPTQLPAGDMLNFAVTQNGTASTGTTTSYNAATGVLTVTGKTAGTYTITATDSLNVLKSTASNVTVTTGAAASANFVQGNVYVPMFSPTTTLTLNLVDGAGNAVATAGVPVWVSLTQVSASNGASATLNGGSKVELFTNSSGQATANFAAALGTTPTALADGSYGTWQAQVTEVGTTPITSGPSEKITVQPSTVTKLAASLSSATPVAGQSVTLTVYGYNQYGASATTPDTLSVSLPAGFAAANGAASPVSVTLNKGTATLALIAKQAGSATVNVADTSVSPNVTASATSTVSTGTPTGGELFMNGAAVTAPVSVTANTPVALTVEAVDAGGNVVPVTTTGGLVVTLTTSSATGSFRSSPTAAGSETTVTIPYGFSSATVYYVDGTTGSVTLGAH